ncbi:MAG: RCC1 domain-containing protein, partial [Chloroflexota bacterium]|nr:RCC1 domain-containing protein [Chloroflexota bacterium]
VVCWGNDLYGQATPPEGEFASVSAGRFHTCGVRADGSVACWGSNYYEG